MSWAASFMRDMVTKPLRTVWTAHGFPPDDLDRIELSSNPEPSIDTAFKIATAAQTTIGLSALAASFFHHLRLPKEIRDDPDYFPQGVRVDSKHAVLEFFGERYYTINGVAPPTWKDDPLTDMYPTRDGGYVRLGCNFPHHKKGMLELLGCPDDKAAVAAAMLQVDANAFVEKAQSIELCAAALNDFVSIDASAQGKNTVNLSPVQVHRIDGVPHAPKRKEPLPSFGMENRPLEGIRMLDMTRLLSAPLAGRTMAMHGADVLYVTAPHLVATPEYDRFTSLGKRTAQLNIDLPDERAKLLELLKDADVFVQSYRPGSLAGRGLSPKDLAEMRPGIVYASMGTFSHTSPCWFRRGFARDIEIMGGYVCEEAKVWKEWLEMQGEDTSNLPRWRDTPVCAVAHLAGLFLTFGIIDALCKTITEGGSWEVHVSLESVALWMRHLGQLSADEAYDDEDKDMPRLPPRIRDPADGPPTHGLGQLDDRVAEVSIPVETDMGDSGHGVNHGGPLTYVRHAAELEATPVQIGKAPAGLNAHLPRWLPLPGEQEKKKNGTNGTNGLNGSTTTNGLLEDLKGLKI